MTTMVLIIAAALRCEATQAQPTLQTFVEEGRPISTLEVDNDSLLLGRDDGFYTSGLRYSQSYRLRTAEGWRFAGWRLGQQLYTPSDVRIPPARLNPLDRPYAGWLYGGFFYAVVDADGSELSFGLDIGCLGPCAGGRATQSFIHKVLDQPEPRGWSSQLGNEPGLVLRAGGRAPFWRFHPNADLRAGVSVRAGNIFTDLSAEATLRAGRLQMTADGAGVYGFARGAVRVVGYDATLQGGMLSDEDGRTVRPRRVTGEWELGIQWQDRSWAWRLSVVRRGNEIAGLAESLGRQDFLRLVVSYFPQ
jgi:lipid A 3-O-deacylase